jgi:hypothetical protein
MRLPSPRPANKIKLAHFGIAKRNSRVRHSRGERSRIAGCRRAGSIGKTIFRIRRLTSPEPRSGSRIGGCSRGRLARDVCRAPVCGSRARRRHDRGGHCHDALSRSGRAARARPTALGRGLCPGAGRHCDDRRGRRDACLVARTGLARPPLGRVATRPGDCRTSFHAHGGSHSLCPIRLSRCLAMPSPQPSSRS